MDQENGEEFEEKQFSPKKKKPPMDDELLEDFPVNYSTDLYAFWAEPM